MSLDGLTVLRRTRVRAAGKRKGGADLDLEVLEGPLEGEVVAGIAYAALGCIPEVGDEALANTLGLEMGLGTGGIALVLPASSGEAPENRDHFVKLPYTPLQLPSSPPPQADSLCSTPVAVLPLHSHLAPACCAAATLWPGCRVAFVWQEGGALPAGFSRIVRELKERELLRTVVSSGNCFGGDLEAPNVYSALLAAAETSDVIVAGIGPGVVGTATTHGHGGMSAAIALNAAASLGAGPVLALRVSLADPRERHRGLSHHSRAALEAALAGCRVAIPEKARNSFGENLPERHEYVSVDFGAGGLQERFGLTFESMGRGYTEDPVFFDAAAAAVALAFGGEEGGAR